jgi:CheY-like chemotaxis protein
VEGNYLLIFLLFISWVDLIIFDLKKDEWQNPLFQGEILSIAPDQWAIQIKISGLLRPAWNQLPEQLIARFGSDSPMIANLNVIGFALQNELCKIEFEVAENQAISEVLTIPIRPISTGKSQRLFTEKNPLRLLIAEDHFLNQINFRTLCEEIFEYLHLDIVSNGREAVEKVAQEKNYDLVLLDLEMPVLGGTEAARQIRTFSDTPILVLSRMASHQKLAQATEAGVNGFLEKPLKKRNLLAAVREFL